MTDGWYILTHRISGRQYAGFVTVTKIGSTPMLRIHFYVTPTLMVTRHILPSDVQSAEPTDEQGAKMWKARPEVRP